jgi:hypothetical protein
MVGSTFSSGLFRVTRWLVGRSNNRASLAATGANVRQARRSPIIAFGLLVGGALAAQADAAEICRYAGTTDYEGHVAVISDVAAAGDVTRVDVAVTFQATWMVWFHVQYLMEEVSTWRAGEVLSVAVNSRYVLNDRIVRQTWDEFQREADGLQASRVQAKTAADLRRRHPGFVQHWDPATFGQPWGQDYQTAPPERRTDLDLKGAPLPAGLRSPLAMAFYWIRRLPHSGQDVQVFLPGFKSEKTIDLPMAPTVSPDGTVWHVPLHYSVLSKGIASTATARTSPDGHLLHLAAELHGSAGSARGQIDQQGCAGAPTR